MAEIPDEIRERLEAAERVCVLSGWTASNTTIGSDIDKALYMLWRKWTMLPGVDPGPQAHPDLNDEVIASLARQRDDLRAETLERLGVLTDQHGPADPLSDPCGAPPIGDRDEV